MKNIKPIFFINSLLLFTLTPKKRLMNKNLAKQFKQAENQLSGEYFEHFKMKNILIIIALLTTMTVQGQQLEIGLNSGLSYTKISTDPLILRGYYSSRINGSLLDLKRLSLASEIYLRRQHKRWFYQIGIQNIQFGYHAQHVKISEYLGDNRYSYWKGIQKRNDSYLHLPLRLGYKTGGKKLKCIFNFGASPGYLLSSRNHYVDYPNSLYRKTKLERVEKFNFNVLAGLGLMYELNENFDIQMQFSRQIGLINLIDEKNYPNNYSYHRGSFLTLGINYKINKKSKSE